MYWNGIKLKKIMLILYMLKKMEIKKYIFYICYVERGLNFIVVVII